MSVLLCRVVLAAVFCSASAAQAQEPLDDGLAGALRGCEEWILNPASWVNGPAPFVAKVGLGDKMGIVGRVDESNLPPRALRAGNHYWRINSTATAGYVLVVSDQLPMCHVTGGGDADLQPVAEKILTGPDFGTRWQKLGEQSRGDMITTSYRNKKDSGLSLVVSRAQSAGLRRDRVQLVATATYKVGK
jgi:hypothetical protein